MHNKKLTHLKSDRTVEAGEFAKKKKKKHCFAGCRGGGLMDMNLVTQLLGEG